MARFDKNEPVEFENVEVVTETASALLCRLEDRDEPVWFPKTQIDDDSEVFKEGTSGKLIVSHWIAVQRGLV